ASVSGRRLASCPAADQLCRHDKRRRDRHLLRQQGGRPVTQYVLNVIEPTGGQLSPEELEPIVRDVVAVDNEMKEAGVWVFAGGLHDPSSATVVRVEDGE